MEDYYWDTVNETKVGDYLTRKGREFIDSFLEDNKIGTCLDVACGSGRFSIPIFQHGINIVAVDYDLVPLKKLKAKNESLSIQICRGDANKLPFKKSSFDCVVSIETVDYLDAEKFIRQCNKLLKIDGFILFTLSNNSSYKKYIQRALSKHRIFYRYAFHDIVSYLEKEGFKVERCIGYNWIPFKRGSNSNLIATFEILEKILRLEYFSAFSPWVFFIAKKTKESYENTC
ncbi:MAG: class I SAM-dependent methyltransferase [Candidatus Methanoperedens sp.]|nr:class I SAM-dependent methyltransferase [Candidatus Methanoperedens sp.]MCZ7395497.1 class I SAM-dependent methyltransferase [Candidatus Methanoperedens sp.]